MRVLIISDTHKQIGNLNTALEDVKNIDLLIHCGDVEGSEDCIREMAGCPTIIVSGNNDFFSILPREEVVDIGPYRAWITHGHTYYVSAGYGKIKQEAFGRNVDMVIFGHTHRPLIDTSDPVIALNPGSLSYPRQENRRPSYILMELDEKDELHFHLKYI